MPPWRPAKARTGCGEEDGEEVVGEAHQEPEGDHGVQVVLVDVVGVPFVGELVEALVFDGPAAVADLDDEARGGGPLGEAGGPEPLAGLRVELAAALALDRGGSRCAPRTSEGAS